MTVNARKGRQIAVTTRRKLAENGWASDVASTLLFVCKWWCFSEVTVVVTSSSKVENVQARPTTA